MASSKAIIAAARDNDLRERAIALCAEGRFDKNPQYFVESNLFQLAAAPVNDGSDTVASVYEYAQAIYEQKKAELNKQLAELEATRPGLNPAAVTDEHLKYALANIASINTQPADGGAVSGGSSS